MENIILYKKILYSIIKSKGENIEFISNRKPFHDNAKYKVIHSEKEYIFHIFVDGCLDSGYFHFDYIDLITCEGDKLVDFDTLDYMRIDPFTKNMKPLYHYALIIKHFHDSYLRWEQKQ